MSSHRKPLDVYLGKRVERPGYNQEIHSGTSLVSVQTTPDAGAERWLQEASPGLWHWCWAGLLCPSGFTLHPALCPRRRSEEEERVMLGYLWHAHGTGLVAALWLLAPGCCTILSGFPKPWLCLCGEFHKSPFIRPSSNYFNLMCPLLLQGPSLMGYNALFCALWVILWGQGLCLCILSPCA